MSNDTNVDDSPEGAPDDAPGESQRERSSDRQGDRSPVTDSGDRPEESDGRPTEGVGRESEPDESEQRPSDGFDEGPDGGDDDIETVEDLGSEVDVDPGVEIDEENAEDDLLGGLKIDSTSDIEVPDRLVDQVIGQDEARDIIIKAAKQRRHVMMIGSPGTGKSMLAKAMSQLLPQEDLQDV
ncbi:ATP-binding protein, partial [Natronococcus sp.]|uniref:ATP-binding protein n=1 Tax=Natronococcus sp. TaxID=35747 RepID=UPI0025D24CF5